MKRPFEYFALRALILWECDESNLHEGIKNNPTPEIIRESLRHFGIARSFAGIGSDPTALQFIADTLRDITEPGDLTADEAHEKVALLAKQFKTRFKRSSISAASKLLWLKHQTPFIIYDSRAIRALGYVRKPKYPDYCVEWRRRYQSSRDAIVAAAGRLVEIGDFVSSWRKSPDDLPTLIGEDWFHERIFDVYLWETGGDG